MEEQKEKRVLSIELDNDVKKVSITGTNGEEQVVMRQELNEDDLEQATGGGWYETKSFGTRGGSPFYKDPTQLEGYVDTTKQHNVSTELEYGRR
jgi:hypothetical protein